MAKRNNETVEPIFLYRDETKFSRGLGAVKNNLPIVNEVLSVLAELLDEPIAEDEARNLVVSRDVRPVETRAFERCRTQVEGLPSIVRLSAQDDLQKRFSLIYSAISRISSDWCNMIGYMNFKDGRFELNEDGESRFKRYCECWLTDPEAIEKRKQHLAVAEALNVFFNGSVPIDWEEAFAFGEDGGFTVNDFTDYELFV